MCGIRSTECEMRESKNKYCIAPVWFNSNIKIGDICVFLQEWYYHSVKTIEDFIYQLILDLNQNYFQQHFQLSYVCTIEYSSIINVILKYMKYFAVDQTFLI